MTAKKKESKPSKKPEAEKKAAGRPSLYSEDIVAAICERIANGESLRKICEDETMPGRRTVLDWLDDERNADFRAKYARAREAQADWHAEQIIEIADTPVMGTKSVSKATGLEITEGDMIEHRRLQVLARQWYAAKLAPKKYGDKQHVEMEVINPMAERMQKARERAKGK